MQPTAAEVDDVVADAEQVGDERVVAATDPEELDRVAEELRFDAHAASRAARAACTRGLAALAVVATTDTDSGAAGCVRRASDAEVSCRALGASLAAVAALPLPLPFPPTPPPFAPVPGSVELVPPVLPPVPPVPPVEPGSSGACPSRRWLLRSRPFLSLRSPPALELPPPRRSRNQPRFSVTV